MSSLSATPPLPSASASATSELARVAHGGLKPVVQFVIGLLIILAASILNAVGLNFTKLDHVRNAAIPKSARRRDWLRPLWLLGMILYILSQLIGSTLALEYMRAEYVAPLGSSSLVFNFLFANLLVGTQITRTDIYGTVVVVIGVIGIVAFGSINSGLTTQMSLARLETLWSRAGWLIYFILTSVALLLLFISASQLDAILASRADIDAVPFSAETRRAGPAPTSWFGRVKATVGGAVATWRIFLEHWTSAQTDRHLAWTLGITWACCGGGLAGECLVFAKATVKLISGKLSHTNDGNQFAHPAAIFTFILLAVSAVTQIIALNKGLRAYDSTLVVPTFYGIYTAFGFLNSLIFNDEVDAYKPWVLALIFFSILILIGGVMLLTTEKPDPAAVKASATGKSLKMNKLRSSTSGGKGKENEPLNADGVEGEGAKTMWEVGEDDSDDDDADDPKLKPSGSGSGGGLGVSSPGRGADDVRSPFIGGPTHDDDEDDDEPDPAPPRQDPPKSSSSTAANKASAAVDDDDEFGEWEDGGKATPPQR
ncbi:hypothetical protein AURDEDRAFT_111319 [Auricularia subglabra TFB-10046 SS5]|nr:hypothetical protein AURDEDRAFT_111319 [Auricularia subglabra TFB-10046 SS5]